MENKEPKLNKMKITGIMLLVAIIIAIIIVYIIYSNNESFRNYADENILKKDLSDTSLKTIELDDYDKSTVFAYYKYIAVLKENVLTTYNTSGKKENEQEIKITTPLITTKGKNVIIAENNSSKAYFITDNNLKWEKEFEGNISRMSVNSNGYAAIILTGTLYKSVIIVLDEEGNEIFKTYLANTLVEDAAISEDNRYLSYAEINTSGTLIQSNIKTIDTNKAKETPNDAVVGNYQAPQNSLAISVKYQNKTDLICMFDDSICKIKDGQSTKIADIDTKNEKITFYSINLNNVVIKNIEESTGILNTQTTLKIINTANKKENTYKFYGVVKELYSVENKIALNLGSEVHFVANNGWLIKKYNSNQEIRKIVLSNEIAGLVYRNKIEIIKL